MTLTRIAQFQRRIAAFVIPPIAGLTLTCGAAFAYDKANVTNHAGFDVQVEVDYAACRKDVFAVAAGQSAVPSANRGACLITKITGTGASPVTSYESSGTAYSSFVIQALPAGTTNYRIWSAEELQAELTKSPAASATPVKTTTTGKVVFAHMVNTTAAVDWAMGKGANAVEMDLRFDANGEPVKFQHSAKPAIEEPCDCVLGDGNTNPENVCSHLAPPMCNSQTAAAVMLEHLASFPNQLAIVYIDSKVSASDPKKTEPPNLAAAGTNVVHFIDAHLFAKGYKGQVVINSPEINTQPYLAASVVAANASANKASYYFTIDGESSFNDVMQELLKSPTMNRVYSVGQSAISPATYYTQVALGAENQRRGVLAATGIWTLDKATSMQTYIDLGASSIMTNMPGTAVKVFADDKMTLAKPGEALKPATSNNWVRTVSTGGMCNSNADCSNNACGRGTANDNAPKICCSSGKIDTFGGFDYCTGMASGAVCWSNAMCAAGLSCKGGSIVHKGTCG